MNKFVIVAPKRTGKTTLVNKLLECTNKHVIGFQTRKDDTKINENGLWPLYIFPVGKSLIKEDKYLVGYCGKGKHTVNNDVFNTTGVELISTNNKDDLIIMDEVGFMETNAKILTEKIFEVLNSNNPVLIMLKDKNNVELLEKIKNVNNIELIYMNVSNRDEVFEKIKKHLS